MRVLIVGYGYVGAALAGRLLDEGHEVWALRRSVAQASPAASALHFLQADITDPTSLSRLPVAYDWVVNCVSSTRGGVDEYRAVYVEGMRHLFRWLRPSPPQKFVYTSSTGVYGQVDGSTVNEHSSAVPSAETARVLLEAEQLLLAVARDEGFPTVILRVAGIYGPGRGYWFKQFLQGEARIDGDGSRVLNSIHVEDVAGSIIAALKNGVPGQIYNAADDLPMSQLEFFSWLAETLRKPLPPRSEPDADLYRKRGLTNKRVLNTRLRTELGYALKYPSCREGYAAEIERVMGKR